MNTYETARQRMMDTVKSPQSALRFMRRILTNDDLPREELLVMLGEFCEKFPPNEEDGDGYRRNRTPFSPQSWQAAEVFLG